MLTLLYCPCQLRCRRVLLEDWSRQCCNALQGHFRQECRWKRKKSANEGNEGCIGWTINGRISSLSAKDFQIYSTISDKCVWSMFLVHHVAHRVREPWLHFYRFLCIKKRSDRLHIVELVSRAIYNIQSSFAQLVGTMNIWTNDAFTFASKVGTNDHEDDPVFQQSTMFSVAASLLLQNAATFDRRVVRQFQRLEFDSDGNLTLPTDCLAYSVNQILTLIMLMLGNTVRP